MKLRVLYEAERELQDAMNFLEDRRDGLGGDLYERVNNRILEVGEHPMRFPLYEGKELSREFRCASISRFPYIVVYEVREDEVLIVALAHTSRRTGYWEHRK